MFTPVQTPRTRKTRIVCISDTHNASPADGAFKLPTGDVLIHAGDLTNQGSLSEITRTVQWLEEADYKAKIVIAGNHDLNLDPVYHSARALVSKPSDSDLSAARSLLISSSSITYLVHSSAVITLPCPDGPPTVFRIFGSPCVPARGPDWAFSYPADSRTASELWKQIPLDTDIVVTHTPAYNHCDQSPKWGSAGCKELRNALWNVRPRLAICGHVHEARGAEVVRWKLGLRHVTGAEEWTEGWRDPGIGRKMSLLDLTGKIGRRLVNDGGVDADRRGASVGFSVDGTGERYDEESDSSSTSSDEPRILSTRVQPTTTGTRTPKHIGPALGLHQTPTSLTNGRQGRLETCIVNAAIMARSHGNGPKRYNKPIVVDVDLPISSSPVNDRQAVEDFIHHLKPVVPMVPSYTTYSSTTSSSTRTTSDDESDTSTSAETIHNTFYSR